MVPIERWILKPKIKFSTWPTNEFNLDTLLHDNTRESAKVSHSKKFFISLLCIPQLSSVDGKDLVQIREYHL